MAYLKDVHHSMEEDCLDDIRGKELVAEGGEIQVRPFSSLQNGGRRQGKDELS